MLSAVRSNRTFPSALIILLICSSSAAILYKVFFLFSASIWSVGEKICLEDYAPHTGGVEYCNDGIELYCLYILVFTCIALSFFILGVYRILLNFRGKFSFNLAYCLLLFSLFLNACFFFGDIGFYPPMFYAITCWWVYPLALIITVSAYFLFKLSVRFEKIAAYAVSIILIPVCFVATAPMFLADYSFIFAPALRMIHHFKMSEIYFQYDLLLSLFAALWMKLGLDLNDFQVLGQFSIYAFLLGSFFFSKRLFFKKELSFYLLTALVLIKIYALIDDPVVCFQVTPLRLDWWLLLVILAYEKGLYSRWTGLALGILIVFHRTFGIIYAVCYLETVSMLLLLDFFKNIRTAVPVRTTLGKHFKCNIGNAVIIVLSLGISALWFGSSLESATMYQKIGIGFLKITKTSFYWYVPVMLSAASIYLLRLKGKLSDGYFATGLFLIFLAVGNSIYFFGRSHENNIINISGTLVFALFILFDLLALKYDRPMGNNALTSVSVKMLPSLFLLLLLLFYSGKIYAVTGQKLYNMKELQLTYPMPPSLYTQEIKELTDFSPNVYFVGEYNFYYCYYGGYVPQGRVWPYGAWVYKKDLVTFLQSLIEKGYYIVFLKENYLNPKPFDELLSALKYNRIVEADGFKVIRN